MSHCTIVVYIVVYFLFHGNGLFCFISYLKKKKHILACFGMFFSLPCSKFLSPEGQLWANTSSNVSKFHRIGVPKCYSKVNVFSV